MSTLPVSAASARSELLLENNHDPGILQQCPARFRGEKAGFYKGRKKQIGAAPGEGAGRGGHGLSSEERIPPRLFQVFVIGNKYRAVPCSLGGLFIVEEHRPSGAADSGTQGRHDLPAGNKKKDT